MRVNIKKRLSHRFSGAIAYSFGKSIDTGSDVTAGTTLTEYGSAASNRGLSDFDQRHRINLNFTYDAPWFKRSHGVTRALLAGWKLSTNQTYATGNPFTATAGDDFNADGGSNDRPLLLDPQLYRAPVDNAPPNPATGCPPPPHPLPLPPFYPP